MEDISADDLLSEYFEDIYFKLHEKGVPDARQPNPEFILSMIMEKFVDQDMLNDWIEDFAKIHHDPIMVDMYKAIEENRDKLPPDPRRKRTTPSYLKVLDQPKDKAEEPDDPDEGDED